MECNNGLFKGTPIDSHTLKIDWTLDLPDNRHRNVYHFNPEVYVDNIFSSSEFSMSENCRVKWKMVCQDMLPNYHYKIGLKRNDSEQCAVDGFCSVKVHISNEGVSKNDSFEFHSLRKGETILTKEMELYPSSSTPRGFMLPPRNPSATDMRICITGIIIARNCCTKKEEKDSLDKNICQLQQDFKTFFKAKQITDVTLNVRNEIVPAHKFVLSARSPVFRKMFSQDMVENNQNNFRVDDIDKPVMEAFLSFLYTGVLEDREFNTVFELYSVADKYEVATLFETCRHILTSHLSVRTVTPLLKLADMHSDDELKDIAIKYICDHFTKVETSDEWGQLLDTNPRLASNTLRKVSANVSK